MLRTTNHTAMVFKDKKILLVVAENINMQEFKNKILSLEITSAIFLDGGGSTQMNYKEGRGLFASRGLNTVIGIKGV